MQITDNGANEFTTPDFDDDGDLLKDEDLPGDPDGDGNPNDDLDCTNIAGTEHFFGELDFTDDDCLFDDNTPKGASQDRVQTIDEDGINPELPHWDADSNTFVMNWKSPKKGGDIDLPNNVNLEGEWFVRMVMFTVPIGDPVDACDINDSSLAGGIDTDGDGELDEACLEGEQFDPDSNFLVDLDDPKLPDGNHLLATGAFILTKDPPGAGPPPSSEDDPITDSLLALIAGLNADGEIAKKQDKDMRAFLNTAIAEFGAGGDSDPEGCTAYDEFEAYVDAQKLNKVSQTAKNAISPAIDTAQGAAPDGHVCADTLAPATIPVV